METTNQNQTIKAVFLQNIPLFFAMVVTVANLYIASLLAPLKTDINAVAKRVDVIEENGTVQGQLSDKEIENIEQKITEIKTGIDKLNDKFDRHLEGMR